MSTNAPLLELDSICKSFGSLRANDNVSLALNAGEIHALLGENGAGKSTLIKILCGVLPPDSGTMLWHGKPIAIGNPAAARALGIGTVFQHFSLFAAMTVAENVALSLPPMPRDKLYEQIDEITNTYGMPLQPNRPLHTLSVGEWQRVEIIRCLLAKPELLVLDEPTSVLTPQEAKQLFEALKKLAADGKAVLYISHRLNEIRELCDKTTVMRQGRVVAQCDPKTETPASLAEMMVGKALQSAKRHEQAATQEHTRSGLEIKGLSLAAKDPFGTDISDLHLAVKPGKIMAIAGIAGNGQAELAQVLSGEQLMDPQAIMLDGKPIGNLGTEKRRALGLQFIPEERNGHAAVPAMTLWENTLLTARHEKQLAPAGMIDQASARAYAAEVISSFKVAAPDSAAAAGSLSGGNMQKFIVGRELLLSPSTLIAMQPTWGVDAGAAASVRQALLDLAQAGAAVLIVSQDLDEVFEIADEIAVINEGTLSEPKAADELTSAQVGLLMGGVHGG